MTLEEAKIVASIVETAEGGCAGCMNEALKELNAKFPAFDWTFLMLAGYMPAINVKPRAVAAKPAFNYERIRC